MHGRPMLGKHRMVTVATRVEPQEVERLKELASECGLSVCAYMRDMIRLELGRANRAEARANGEVRDALNGAAPKLELAS
jgi:hypothetical protein